MENYETAINYQALFTNTCAEEYAWEKTHGNESIMSISADTSPQRV